MKPYSTVIMLGLLSASTIAIAQQDVPVYKQAKAPIDARLQDLLGRMTLDEKVAQLQSNTVLPLGANTALGIYKDDKLDADVAKRSLANGVGTFSLLSMEGIIKVAHGAALSNAVQSWVIKNTRLGIPVMFHGEALHGAVANGATSFPEAIGLGSTWDPALMRQLFTVAAKQARAAGYHEVLAPVLDLAREPRWGRIEEMYSEDPYLVGEMGLAAVQGLQGTGPLIDKDHALATAKHFVHGQPQNGTNVGPTDFSERTMRSDFLAPFEKVIKQGQIGAVMPSYNENNGGLPSSANRWLLKDILRKEWGFQGVTVSDYFAVPQLQKPYGLAQTVPDAGLVAFRAGLDMELPNPAGYAGLADAVRAGKVPEKDIDEAVSRVLRAKFRLGLFENPYADPNSFAIDDKANAQLARKVADEAIILLKNDNKLLPLDARKIKTIAVIGPNADQKRLGGYSGVPPYFVTVLQGIKARVGKTATVTFAEGVRISEPDDGNHFRAYVEPSAEKDAALIAQAVETAKAADTVVLVLGGNENVAREAPGDALGGKPIYGDTDTLELPGRQNALVQAIMKLGKPTVAVLINGRPYFIEELSRSVPAIVEGWYGGQETGNAVAGILFGDVNPSGRLPVTIGRNVGQLPVYYYRQPAARMGYVFNDNAPLYPFGYGLSYTSFTYGKPTLDRTAIARNGQAKVSVSIMNSGDRAGAEVAQLYVHPQVSSVAQPIKRLAGFKRVELKPGQSTTVTFPVGAEQLAIWDSEMKRTVEPGKVDLMVGPNVQKTDSIVLDVQP